jgi:hypothetical protein
MSVYIVQIFARPEGIHSGKWFSSGDFKDLRISLLLRKIQDFDIVILQVTRARVSSACAIVQLYILSERGRSNEHTAAGNV